ncbi:unnamed protein product [Caenorhabditis bovis]|uniref:Inosine/uridine-preferring nucleoside hydrolase domain-containing protein n=1 Tax=Caenorhabditis bovis TaxID=2654633 RepID=A0A8S1E5G8_9PELO|nr:unnamed protein product [Caenorhabditis bovis]
MTSTLFKIQHDAIICQLHHKSNATINVVCETSDEIAMPMFDNCQQTWVVPNDVVGLDSKKPKMLKIRFHPDVVELAASNADIHSAACASSLQYLDVLLEDSEWTRRAEFDTVGVQLDRLSQLFTNLDIYVDFKPNHLEITWIPGEDHDELVKLLTSKSVRASLLQRVVVDGPTTSVFMSFEKDANHRRNLLEITINNTGIIDDRATPTQCEIDTTATCVTWRIPERDDGDEFKKSPPRWSSLLDCTLHVNNQHRKPLQFISPYSTIANLYERLCATLHTSASSPIPTGSLSKVSANIEDHAIIALDKNEAPQLTKLIYMITSTPLVINTDIEIATETELTWSPTDSIDSGVSLSPTLSLDEPFLPMPRGRSASECAPPSAAGNHHTSTKLKGILKYPMRFGRFSRSVSECHHDDVAYHISPYFAIDSHFSEDEEDSDAFHESCAETTTPPPQRRKKCVSFSERIEKRVFHSNTSIDAQKRKNQKKNEKRKRRDAAHYGSADDATFEEVRSYTDGVSDDVRAISLALQHPKAEVLAITTVHGCVPVDQACANVKRTLRANGFEGKIPVYRGSAKSILNLSKDSTVSDFFGVDGIGDEPKSFPEVVADDFVADEKLAPLALLEIFEKNPDATLVTIGPLTNVAVALQLSEAFASAPARMVIMGGNYYGVGNVADGSTAEYNFHGDPEAASIVLRRMKCPITVVPWEAFFFESHLHENAVDFHAHLSYDTPLAKYLKMATSVGRKKLEANGRQYAYCDEIAMAVAIDEEKITKESKNLHVDVELAGYQTRGQVVVDWMNELWMNESRNEGNRPIKFITSYNVEIVDKWIHAAASGSGKFD